MVFLASRLDALTQTASANTIVFWLMLAFGLATFISIIRRGLHIAAGKQIATRAKVVDKCTHHQNNTTDYQIAFMSSGIVVRLSVPKMVHNQLQIGDTGRLVYQGKRFISFR